ncbi:isoafricanol synthase [Streptomyces chitinivorans]|uniref:Terpene synthase n=1 Tax=Streptomyces chitinivorans TaxID=1257027 RepID=A0ABW7I264_9ACTN|nr:isoafricanol synthase [Streptomyces chitinivorans]MDH2411004.1 isoafricanol synthase [Streptomyces chitinivorans]
MPVTEAGAAGDTAGREGLLRRTAHLEIPFPGAVSPAVGKARLHTLRWLGEFGLLSGEAALEEYDALRLERAMARFYPRAADEDLMLATDVNGWFFVFDDRLDGPSGRRPHDVTRLVDRLVRVMDGRRPPSGVPADPLVESFRDLWHRVNEGMPPVWRDRFRGHWHGYLLAHHREALNRSGAQLPTVEEFLAARRHTIGIQPCLDLAERCGRYTLPSGLHGGRPLREMRRITDDVAIFVNDIVSLDKELAAGDVNNTVVLLRHGTGRPLPDCVREIGAAANGRVARFRELAARLPGLLEAAGVPRGTRAHVEDYVDGMRNVMRGNLDWSLESGRYDEAGVAAVSGGRLRPWARPPEAGGPEHEAGTAAGAGTAGAVRT